MTLRFGVRALLVLPPCSVLHLQPEETHCILFAVTPRWDDVTGPWHWQNLQGDVFCFNMATCYPEDFLPLLSWGWVGVGGGKLTSSLPRGRWQRFKEEDRESHKLAWLQFSAPRHHSKLSTLETSPGCTQQDLSRHRYRTLVMWTSVDNRSCLFYFLRWVLLSVWALKWISRLFQAVQVQKDKLGIPCHWLIIMIRCIFVCVPAFVSQQGCGPPLLSLQFVRLWEYRLAAWGFLLYIPSPELSVATPPPPCLGVISHFIWVWSWSSQPSWPLVTDPVGFRFAMSRAGVIVCCPCLHSDLLKRESR